MHAGMAVDKWAGALVMWNGSEVSNPIDLLPVVLPDSRTAKAARRYDERNRPWATAGPIAFTAFVASLGPLIWSVARAASGLRTANGGPIALFIVCLAVGTGTLIAGRAVVGDTEGDRLSAFATYGDDLEAFRRDREGDP